MTTVEWHGFEGWQLENNQVRMVIVPSLGARIASLVDKTSEYEWLAPPTNPVRKRMYGDTFIDHDLSGWDEMFPTIVVCPSPDDPNVELPDHGEVWALPWDVIKQDASSIELRVTGRKMPYTLTRKATLEPDGLRLEYTVLNQSEKPLPCLWAAHPLFNANSHTLLKLPVGTSTVINVAEHPQLGQVDKPLSYPVSQLVDGSQQRLDRVGEPSLKDYRKFYCLPDESVSSTSLIQEDIERELHLSWDANIAPYLGIWIDEGTFTRISTIAIEPSSGYYDSLSLAVQNKRVTIVPSHESMHWWLKVQCIGITT